MIEGNVLSPQELRRAIDAATEPWRAPIMFGVFTGARRAEILGLQWRDIDWTRRTARIERTWRRGAFYSPKTKAGRRTVELPDELVDELRRWKVKCPKGANDFVFPAPQGGPLEGNDLLRTGFYPALQRAGIQQVRFHDLRHSFASNLLAAGWDVVTVSKLLGHANPQITLTIYAHALPKPRHGAADALAKLMSDVTQKRIDPASNAEYKAA